MQYSNSKIKIHHEYNTRNKSNLVPAKQIYKTIGQRSHVFLAPKIYNFIPETLKILSSNKLFKKGVMKFLLETPRNEIHDLIDLKNT